MARAFEIDLDEPRRLLFTVAACGAAERDALTESGGRKLAALLSEAPAFAAVLLAYHGLRAAGDTRITRDKVAGLFDLVVDSGRDLTDVYQRVILAFLASGAMGADAAAAARAELEGLGKPGPIPFVAPPIAGPTGA